MDFIADLQKLEDLLRNHKKFSDLGPELTNSLKSVFQHARGIFARKEK